MHPNLWTASSTNTIKKDSFKSKSSSSGLNSLYTTFNIQEPPRASKDNNENTESASTKNQAVFTLESLFGSSQNTSIDGGSAGTDESGTGSEWSHYRNSTGRYSDRKRRKSESFHRGQLSGPKRQNNRYRISSNSQTIHNVHAISHNYAMPHQRLDPGIPSSTGPPDASTSLPKLLSDDGSESIPEEDKSANFEDFPYDLRSLASTILDSRRKTLDNVSMSTTYSGVMGSYISAQYSKKWRVVIALLVGGILIGLCLLGFYVNAEARRAGHNHATDATEETTGTGEANEESANTSEVTPHVSSKGDEDKNLPAKNGVLLERSSKWRTATDSCEHIDLQCPAGYDPPLVLLIGIDGVRKEMITPSTAPALHHLSKCGVMASHLTPVYPTNTFSNLYTIVTGLYPESHGIIGPVIYDAQRNKTFRVGRYESYKSYWWAGEPIWNTVQNKGLQSAMYYWPGSYVQVGGRYPTYWYKYRSDYPLETGVNKIKEWLLLEEEERPSLLGLYFDNPDKIAQEAGVYSKRANESLLEVDHQVDRLMTALRDRNLASCVDIIVVSDHGSAPSSCGNSLYLETFLPDIDEKARVVPGAVGRLQAIEGKGSNSEILNQLRCKNPKLRALSKDLLPNRYHYAHNKLIEDVILDTLPGNRIVTSDTNYCKKAEHGFNNIEASMQGVFFARGPSFKTNYKTEGFRNVEIYNLLNLLLGATPAPNNGTEGSLYHILRHPPPLPPFNIDAWHENVIPFLHPRSRDPSFLEELKRPLTEATTTSTTTSSPTTTTSAPSTTPSTTTSAPVPPSTTTSENITALPSSTTVASAFSEAPIDTNPNLDLAVPSSTNLTSLITNTSTPSDSQDEGGKALSFPGENEAEKTTDLPIALPTKPSEPADLEGTASPDVTEKTVPVVEMSVNQTENLTSPREAKTVGANLEEEPRIEERIEIVPILSVPTVIMSLANEENKRIDVATDEKSNSDMSNLMNNSTIAIERKVEDVTKVIADVVEIVTSNPIPIKNEPALPHLEATFTNSTVFEAGSSNNSELDSPEQRVSSSTTPGILSISTQPTPSQDSSTSESLNISESSELASTTLTPATQEILVIPSSSTTPSFATTSSTTAQPMTNSPPIEVFASSAEPVTEPAASSRRKRDTCECSSSEILQTERGRGQPARSDHISHHCPFGAPLFEAREAPKGTHYILPFTNHVNGYIGELGTALWTSFTLTNTSLSLLENSSVETSNDILSESPCWLADPRLPRDTQQQCMEYLTDRYNTDSVSMKLLFPEEFESPEVLAREAFFLTNTIALKIGFVEGGRRSIVRLLREWTQLRNMVNVITGPIWDRNLNGRGDTIIHIRSRVDYLTPSHVFYIVSSCHSSSGLDMEDPDLSKCSSDELDVLAFVFPNTELDDNCLMNDRDYCRYHLTSITDIERLTGLQVFSTFMGESSLPALRAQQPLLLWEN
ncbi:Type I phosphodiesterase/nucleotide pyrophosphatase/phosphate transferase [Trinorchestia longiramus]|nr:Type I phosphodiesterase/nucleotide pyrophosphatase/phosphate transferase [Trinorchestia longiramus]